MIVTYDFSQGCDYAPLPTEPSQCHYWDDYDEDIEDIDDEEMTSERGDTGWQKTYNTLQGLMPRHKVRCKICKVPKRRAHIPTV